MHGTVWETLPLQWIITALELRGRDQQQTSTCSRTYQRDLEHRQDRSHHCSCTFANHFTYRVRDFIRGSFFLQEKPTTRFIYYILCDCVQFADTLMVVSHVWRSKMA